MIEDKTELSGESPNLVRGVGVVVGFLKVSEIELLPEKAGSKFWDEIEQNNYGGCIGVGHVTSIKTRPHFRVVVLVVDELELRRAKKVRSKWSGLV